MGAVLHTLNIRLFPELLTYVINHAADEVVIVDESLTPLLAKVAPDLTTVRTFVVTGGGDAGCARRGHRRADRRLRGPARGGAARLRLARGRRALGRGDVLHERHDREPEGCRLLAPLDLAALVRGDRGQLAGAHRSGPHPADRADVPRERLGSPVRGMARRRGLPDAGPVPAGRAADEVRRAGATDVLRRGADDLGRRAALRAGAPDRPVVVPHDRVRWLRRAAQPDGGVRGASTACGSCRRGA